MAYFIIDIFYFIIVKGAFQIFVIKEDCVGVECDID